MAGTRAGRMGLLAADVVGGELVGLCDGFGAKMLSMVKREEDADPDTLELLGV